VWGAENYTYTEDAQGLVAWLNEKIANSSFRVVHVALPTGNVSRGTADLIGLPTGLNLVIQGQGMNGETATTLDLQQKNLDIGAMLGDTGRIEFRNMGITNVRAAASEMPQLLPQSLLFVQGSSLLVPPPNRRMLANTLLCLFAYSDVALASRELGSLAECGGGRRSVEAQRRLRWARLERRSRACHAGRSSQLGFQSF
jgi:hypothetical protein